MTDTAKVENQYRTLLGRALPGARAHAARVSDAFAVTRRAMENEAWVSTVADRFSDACVSKGSSASTAAGDCVGLMQSCHDREPLQVLPFDRRSHWH